MSESIGNSFGGPAGLEALADAIAAAAADKFSGNISDEASATKKKC